MSEYDDKVFIKMEPSDVDGSEKQKEIEEKYTVEIKILSPNREKMLHLNGPTKYKKSSNANRTLLNCHKRLSRSGEVEERKLRKQEYDEQISKRNAELHFTAKLTRHAESSLLNHDKQQELSAEKLAERKRRKQEYDKQRRQRMTPEQKAVANKRDCERKRKSRIVSSEEARKNGSEGESFQRAVETAERREKRLERKRIAARERRKRLSAAKRKGEKCKTPEEQIEERISKRRFRRIEELATMTEEKRNELKIKKFFAQQAYYDRHGRFRDWPEERKKQKVQQHREWVGKLSGDKKRRFLEDSYRRREKWQQRMKEENPERWEELQNRHKERLRKYWKRKLTEETPEERLRRHHKYKVNAAARKLKQQLLNEQVAEEEIARRVAELKDVMWREFDPDYDKRPKMPRGRKRKVTPPPSKKLVNPNCSGSSTISRADVDSQPGTSKLDNVNTDPVHYSHVPSTSISTFETGIDDENVDCEAHFSPYASPVASPLSLSSPEPETSTPIHSRPEPETVKSAPPAHLCLHCSSVFPDDSLLRTHICVAHPEKCWKCPKCKVIVLSPSELSQHYKSVHGNVQEQQPTAKQFRNVQSQSSQAFFCMRCSSDGSSQLRSFETRQNLFFHVKAEHPEHYWPCNYCNLLKYSKESFNVHLSMCREFKNTG